MYYGSFTHQTWESFASGRWINYRVYPVINIVQQIFNEKLYISIVYSVLMLPTEKITIPQHSPL